MNIISYFVIGAAIGSLLAAKKVGNKALVCGGLCALVPAIDWLLSLFLDCPDSLYVNGGVTHSFVFCLLAAPFIGWLLHKTASREMTVLGWANLALWTMFSHCTYDALCIRGVGILEPFSHKRLALSVLADSHILAAVPLVLAFVFAMFQKEVRHKAMISWFGMLLFTVFVSFSFLNKLSVQSDFERRLDEQDMRYSRCETFPVAGALFLWNCIAQDRDGFWMSYKSNLSANDFESSLILRNDYYMFDLEDFPDVKRLTAYTRYFYSVEPAGKSVVLYDLRYVSGKISEHNPFTHSYKMTRDESSVKISEGEK